MDGDYRCNDDGVAAVDKGDDEEDGSTDRNNGTGGDGEVVDGDDGDQAVVDYVEVRVIPDEEKIQFDCISPAA